MFYRYAYSKGVDKRRGLYIMVAILVPLFGLTITLALAEGNPRSAVAMVIGIVGWVTGVLWILRRRSRRQKTGKTSSVTKPSSTTRITTFFERLFWLLVLLAGISGLVKALGSNRPLYDVLEGLAIIVMSGGHFFFFGLLPEE